jgi:hypothetical protein
MVAVNCDATKLLKRLNYKIKELSGENSKDTSEKVLDTAG